MTRLTLEQLLLINLRQSLPEYTRGYMPKETALTRLKELTDQDFGYDVKAWRAWLRNEKKNGRDPLNGLRPRNSSGS